MSPLMAVSTSAVRQARYRERHALVVAFDALPAMCWCDRKVVRVPAGMLREGRTLSCGAVRCGPEAVAS